MTHPSAKMEEYASYLYWAEFAIEAERTYLPTRHRLMKEILSITLEPGMCLVLISSLQYASDPDTLKARICLTNKENRIRRYYTSGFERESFQIGSYTRNMLK